MDMFLRFSLCVSLLVGCVIGIGFGQPKWIADLGLDYWNLSEFNLRINKANQRGEHLDQKIVYLTEKSEYKTRIVEDLIAEKIPLAEASVLVQELTSQEMMDLILGAIDVKETTLNGRAARILIYWVGQELKYDPNRWVVVSSRLEKELKESASLWN